MNRFLTAFVTATGFALGSGSLGCTAGVAAHEVRLPTGAGPVSDRAADLCAGLPGVEQERPSFLRADGIEAVRPVTAESSSTRFAEPELRGVDIVLRPSSTVTKPWVARVLRCHLADPVSVALSGRFEDPLVVGTPAVTVDQTSDRLVLRIAGRDGAEGEEILRRAEQLYRP